MQEGCTPIAQSTDRYKNYNEDMRYYTTKPLRGALWTFCSPKRRSSAVATESGRLRSCSSKSHSLTTTSPVGTDDGHCARRSKSCPPVREVPFSSSAADADLEPRPFPDSTCT